MEREAMERIAPMHHVTYNTTAAAVYVALDASRYAIYGCTPYAHHTAAAVPVDGAGSAQLGDGRGCVFGYRSRSRPVSGVGLPPSTLVRPWRGALSPDRGTGPPRPGSPRCRPPPRPRRLALRRARPSVDVSPQTTRVS